MLCVFVRFDSGPFAGYDLSERERSEWSEWGKFCRCAEEGSLGLCVGTVCMLDEIEWTVLQLVIRMRRMCDISESWVAVK